MLLSSKIKNMKTASNSIIVSEENIEEALEKLEGLEDKGYEELLARFALEQPALLEFASFIKGDNSKKFFEAFFDLMIIIWLAFEEATGKVPEITEEIFEKVDADSDGELENIGELLNIKDEKKLQKKLEDFNDLMSKVNSEEDIKKIKTEMGKDFDIITEFVFNNYSTHVQQTLYSFIMDECDDVKISTAKKPNQEFMLSEELLFVMNCFDAAVNVKPKMKISE
jgi:hypothetical protein